MKLKRILACLFIVAALPLFNTTLHNKPASFSTAAFAGHVTGGGYACTCGCYECICDPGEIPVECGERNRAISDKTNQSAAPVGAAPTSAFDFGSSALMLALAFFAWARLLRT